MKGTKNCRLINEIYETASDLYRLGFIDKSAMARYSALIQPLMDKNCEVTEITSKDMETFRSITEVILIENL